MEHKFDKMFIYKDDKYAVVISKDHWTGISVQVARNGLKNRYNEFGQQVEDRSLFVAWTKTVSTLKAQGQLDGRDGTEFKNSVNKVISEARAELAKLIKLDEMMDGVFNDYYDQARKYNDFGKLGTKAESDEINKKLQESNGRPA